MSKVDVLVWQGDWQGGAERITLEFARYIHARGLAVALGVYATNPNIDLAQIVVSVPRWIPASFRPLIASISLRLRNKARFRAVYSHTLGWWKLPKAALFIHDAADLDMYHATTRRGLYVIASKLWRWLYLRLCLKQATIIFSASHGFTQYLHRHGVTKPTIIASGSFYDEQLFRYSERPQPMPPYRLIFIGNYEDERKNFALLYKTFYKNQQFQLTVAGGRWRGQDENFNYVGYQSSVALATLIEHAQIFLMPSHAEGFSIALLEALATGIPCVVAAKAINQELAGISNLIPFSANNLLPTVTEVIANYSLYQAPDSKMEQFSQSVILEREYQAVRQVLASSNMTVKL